ncbi:hypothetical protein BGW80DRAFT_1474576 [Lactifluus volemus]|nr:hypothetical protein BGW80DRAFT_1474576 [Lactifluus volemus]
MTASGLPLDDYKRYGRQMILDGIGLPGQVKLQQAAVVVVGAGGLGCPALQYLACAGVGRIGIIDHDVVELSNLQRQTLHTESRLGKPKAESAAFALKQINSRLQVEAITGALAPTNARSLLGSYDVILDCTDNRRAGPLLSLLVPQSPVSGSSPTCEETGILGAVTGVIGSLQALEAIRIIVGLHDGQPSLLVYSALGMPPFRSIKLRKRRTTCSACGVEGQRVGKIEDTDYVQFCGGARPDWVTLGLKSGHPEWRITANELRDTIKSKPIRILDVRPKTEFEICHLPSSIHVPLHDIVANPVDYLSLEFETYVVCRLGNDSQIAAEALRDAQPNTACVIKDLVGGLRAWSRDVDPEFPLYYS